MLANQAEQVEVFPGGFAGQLFQDLGFGVAPKNDPHLLIPAWVDAIQLDGTSMDQLFESATLLIKAGFGKLGALEGVEHAQEMLAFAEDNLRSSHRPALSQISH
jgi:hypothetical protein